MRKFLAFILIFAMLNLAGCNVFNGFAEEIKRELQERASSYPADEIPKVTVYDLEPEEYIKDEFCMLPVDKSAEFNGLKITVKSIKIYQDYEIEGELSNFVNLDVVIENTSFSTIYYYFWYDTYILLNTGELAAPSYDLSSEIPEELIPKTQYEGEIVYETTCSDLSSLEYIKIQMDSAVDREGYVLGDDDILFWFKFDLPDEPPADYDAKEKALEYLKYHWLDYEECAWVSYPETEFSLDGAEITIPAVALMQDVYSQEDYYLDLLIVTYLVEFDLRKRQYIDFYDAKLNIYGEHYMEPFYEFTYFPIEFVEGHGFFLAHACYDVTFAKNQNFNDVDIKIKDAYDLYTDSDVVRYIDVNVVLD